MILLVTTVTPMKRGLKAHIESHTFRSNHSSHSYNRYPDEKGTESSDGSKVLVCQPEFAELQPLPR